MVHLEWTEECGMRSVGAKSKIETKEKQGGGFLGRNRQ
jgi:hypothetical protein